MPDRFELFRLSLIPRTQLDVFDDKPNISREDFLRKIFTEDQVFEHHGKTFHYIPAPDNSSGALLGRVGCSITTDANLPPEKGFLEYSHEGWKASVIAIDPREHNDGQKISFEDDKKVGKPSALVVALVNAINDKYISAKYHIEVQPIFEASTFWEFAEENKGNITSLTFDFVVPNMFGTLDSITEEMRDFRDEEKAQRVTVKLVNSDGLQTDTERVENAVNYATKGGGKIKARARGGKTYNSTTLTKYVTINQENEDEPLLVKAARKISEIFGR